MANEAATCAERATSDMLIGPDWSINIELCDIINANPGQAMDALKVLKKQLGSRNPQIQLLTLDVLDTLSKNCGNNVFPQIADADILQDLVTVIKNKPDLRVREKILSLIDTWQEALGGCMGRFPQYYNAYLDLMNMGVKFPPRGKNNVPLYTPPQTRPVTIPVYDEAPVQTSLQTDTSTLSVTEFKSVRDLTDILKEMLGALDPRNSEGAKEEVILDLVDQCRSYQKRVMLLLNSTSDEDLLFQGLALNDTLLNVLDQHENIVKGITPTGTQTTAIPHFNKIHTDHDLEDDVGQLEQRSKSKARTALRKTGSMPVSPLLPPPPSSKNPIAKDANFVDFLSGDFFTLEAQGSAASTEMHNELPSNSSNNTNPALNLSSATLLAPPSNTQDPFSPQEFQRKNPPDEPPSTTKHSPSPPSSSQTIAANRFFDQQASLSHDESASNTLEAPIRSLSLETPTPKKQEKTEDDLFRDLLDFARAMPSSSPSSSRSNKRLS
ncbi:unnamed protein product [Rhodiola kirilowii]